MPVDFTAPEPELNRVSDHVREPATSSIIEGIFMELKRMNWSPAHTLAADGTLCLLSAVYYEDLEELIPQKPSFTTGSAKL